jgi:hypothetical protein
MGAVMPQYASAECHGVLRAIVFRTRGLQRCAVTRLISPSAIGERIKPFVFLYFFNAPSGEGLKFDYAQFRRTATTGVRLLHKARTRSALDCPAVSKNS